MRVLIFGDVVAKPGREALRRWLPELKKEHAVDLTIANVENLAHGKGITPKTLDDLLRAGVDFCTSGNHVFDKDGRTMLADAGVPVIRPANFPDTDPGRGWAIVPAGKYSILVVNLIATAFFRDAATYANPFATIDAILAQNDSNNIGGILVDWHSEATSEKIAMGIHLDGRVSALFGTHTHVATADARILPGGTAVISDVGMTGLRDEVLGVDRSVILNNFIHPDQTVAHRWLDEGPIQLNAVLVEIDPVNKKATRIERIYKEAEE